MTIELIKKEEISLLDHLDEWEEDEEETLKNTKVLDEDEEETLRNTKVLDEAEFIVTKDNLKFLVNISLCESDIYTLTVYDRSNHADITNIKSYGELTEVAQVTVDSCGNLYDRFTIYPLGDVLLNNRQKEVEDEIMETLFGENGLVKEF